MPKWVANDSSGSELIGNPWTSAGPWFRCQRLGYNENIYLDSMTGDTDTHWEIARHGCKFEALYSIMYHGQLWPSYDRGQGHRLLGDVSGIYCHSPAYAHKAENYSRFMPLCKDGVFWCCKWELKVDRSRKQDPKSDTEQWIQKPGSTRLVALWLCGIRYQDMEPGLQFSEAWNPMLEANPNPPPATSSRRKRRCSTRSETSQEEIRNPYVM